MTPLAGWQNFYVIVGSSAGALIGLQFVVITLVASRPISTSPQAGDAFGTPTVVHFGAALLLSAAGSAPWHTLLGPAILWRVLGLTGVIYSIVVARRMRKQTVYTPQFEDWLFHVALPLISYATLLGSAFWHSAAALFAIAAAALLLLFIGIHNAWDAVTYHIFIKKAQ